MNKDKGLSYNIDMSAEVRRVNRLVWQIAIIMFLIPLIFSIVIFVAFLRGNIRSAWESIYNNTVQMSKTATGDFIETNYIRKGKSDNFDEDYKDLVNAARLTGLNRLYVLDPYDMTYYDIYTEKKTEKGAYGKIFQKLSGCLDENVLVDEQRKNDTKEPVYSWDITGTSIKAWTKIESFMGNPYMLCAEYPIEPIIEKCLKNTLLIFGLSLLVSNTGYLLVYLLILKKMVSSISELSDDLDSYHTTGNIISREYQDRMVNKLGQDFLLLEKNNSEYTRVKCEEARKEGGREQRALVEKQVEKLFCPEACIIDSDDRQLKICSYDSTDNPIKDDICDYMMLAPDKAGFMIASMPEGNENAVLPVFLRSAFRSEFSAGRSLEKMAEDISNEIRTVFGEKCIVNAFFGKIDKTGKLRFVNAGYNIPFICEAGEKLRFLEGNCSPGLGYREEHYIQEAAELPEGTLLVSFSDSAEGDTEAPDGREQLKALIDRWNEFRRTGESQEIADSGLIEFLEKENTQQKKTILIIKG